MSFLQKLIRLICIADIKILNADVCVNCGHKFNQALP